MSHGTYYLLCLAVFLVTYCVNLFYISILYHRGLTHGAVRLKPWVQNMVYWTGNWVTGIDPKAWSCMHRLHHLHSDTERDPHSPVRWGVLGVAAAQLNSYKQVLRNLITRKDLETSLVRDLDFPVHWLNRKKLWFLPYLIHAGLAAAVLFTFDAWILALAYWFGMMSHPIQGWMVNSLGHRFGYRNFATSDQSRNNTWVAWLVIGEGYQNNHHHKPQSAKFSVKWWEVDWGYGLCRVAEAVGLLTITR